jgi:cytochrome c556
MFKLRRELQAVMEYADLQDKPRMKKWALRLVTHYRKIGEMVPEWEEELEPQWAARLEDAAGSGDFAKARKAVRKLKQSCKACHREYRAVTAALYRTPDFAKAKVRFSETGKEHAYRETMRGLSTLVNRIKIATEDERKQVALDALSSLRERLGDLSESCSQCHEQAQARERILGADTGKILNALAGSIQADDIKAAGRNLGTAAVVICARCHGVHRTLYDLKKALEPLQ